MMFPGNCALLFSGSLTWMERRAARVVGLREVALALARRRHRHFLDAVILHLALKLLAEEEEHPLAQRFGNEDR